MVEINHFSLHRTMDVNCLRLGWNLNGREFIIRSGEPLMVVGK